MKVSTLSQLVVALVSTAVFPALAQPTAKPPTATAKPAAKPAAAPGGKLTPEQATALLKKVDETARAADAVTMNILLSETQGKDRVIREADVYSEANDTALVVLFTGPKTVSGSGYLRMENNLWSYSPDIGKWERRTDRERLSGTNMRTSDLSVAPLSQQFDATSEGTEKFGQGQLQKLLLKAKPGVNVLFPEVRIWVDDQFIERKREEYSESGKLLRSNFVTKLTKAHSKKLNKTVILPAEIQILDEMEKDRRTVIVFRKSTFGEIPSHVFSKAWLEAKSR